jgi:hypothetical protein
MPCLSSLYAAFFALRQDMYQQTHSQAVFPAFLYHCCVVALHPEQATIEKKSKNQYNLWCLLLGTIDTSGALLVYHFIVIPPLTTSLNHGREGWNIQQAEAAK